MLIAIDAELLYHKGVRYPGNAQLIENLMAFNPDNTFLCVGIDEDTAKKAIRFSGCPNIPVIDRISFKLSDLSPVIHIARESQKTVKSESVILRG